MFNQKSKILFVAALLGSLYFIYLVSYFMGVNINSTDNIEQAASTIATALVMPHMFFIFLASLLSFISFFTKRAGFALAGAILYCVAAFMFLLYAIFCIPLIILGFVGYSKQKKLNMKG